MKKSNKIIILCIISILLSFPMVFLNETLGQILLYGGMFTMIFGFKRGMNEDLY